MAIRNVYTTQEQEIIANFNKQVKNIGGWIGDEPTADCPNPVLNRVVSKELILRKANIIDPWNPLWRDEQYARNTRWGGTIAPPFFPSLISIGGVGRLFLKIPSGAGVERWFVGTEWELFLPIRVGDSFKVWLERPKLIDITALDGKGLRKFRIISSDIKYINQNDETVVAFKRYFDETILTEPEKAAGPVEIASDYRYSKEELEYIDRIAFEEDIRGARIRFWEDVDVREIPKPVVLGPLTPWDLAIEIGSLGFIPSYKRVSCRKIPDDGGILDPVTNVVHKSVEIHLSDSVAQLMGSTKSSITSGTSENLLGRLLTNWMGDDGIIRKFSWRMLSHTHCGDTLIARGKITRKYIQNGEHLADFSLWTESMAEGEIHHLASATVKLVSKEDAS